jgi:hypothetical protein
LLQRWKALTYFGKWKDILMGCKKNTNWWSAYSPLTHVHVLGEWKNTLAGCIKAQLDGTWLGSFYVITDVIHKESYSNAPCIQPGVSEYNSLSMM